MLDRVYQRIFIDTYSKLAFAKLYDRKTPITAAELLNGRAAPFFDENEVRLSRALTDRGINYCGSPEHPECELYISIENIDLTRTKTKSPRTTDVIDKNFFQQSAVSLGRKSPDLIHRTMSDFAVHLMAASLASGPPCQ